MDNNIEDLVQKGTENVEETTTEEIVEGKDIETRTDEQADVGGKLKKLYTEDELNQKVNEVVGKRIARKEAKIRKEYEEKYGELERVLTAGTGESDVSKITKNYRNYYESKGVKIPSRQEYSQRDIEVLGMAEANDIIDSGWEDVVTECDRLADIGVDNMSARDRVVFQQLATYRHATERNNELAKIGVSTDEINSKEFTEFASQFNAKTPITKIYELYNKTKPKKETKSMGSMTQTSVKDTGLREDYTYEEAVKFTDEDYDKNPGLLEAVSKSMAKWK